LADQRRRIQPCARDHRERHNMGNTMATCSSARDKAGDLSKANGGMLSWMSTDGQITDRVNSFILKKKFFLSNADKLYVRNARDAIVYKVLNKTATEHSLVMMDESGKKLCMLAKDPDGPPVFRVYTYIANYPGQNCERRLVDNDGTPVYKWAIVNLVLCGIRPHSKLSIFVGDNMQRPVLLGHVQCSGGFQLCVTAVETGDIVGFTGDAAGATVFSLTVAAGSDALGMICLTIAADDLFQERLQLTSTNGPRPAWPHMARLMGERAPWDDTKTIKVSIR